MNEVNAQSDVLAKRCKFTLIKP